MKPDASSGATAYIRENLDLHVLWAAIRPALSKNLPKCSSSVPATCSRLQCAAELSQAAALPQQPNILHLPPRLRSMLAKACGKAEFTPQDVISLDYTPAMFSTKLTGVRRARLEGSQRMAGGRPDCPYNAHVRGIAARSPCQTLQNFIAGRFLFLSPAFCRSSTTRGFSGMEALMRHSRPSEDHPAWHRQSQQQLRVDSPALPEATVVHRTCARDDAQAPLRIVRRPQLCWSGKAPIVRIRAGQRFRGTARLHPQGSCLPSRTAPAPSVSATVPPRTA
ncbi:hypothetical protein ACVWZ6_009157 [Bradyrhizobium sp. GM6.1]